MSGRKARNAHERGRRWSLVGMAVVATSFGGACIDEDERCDTNQVLVHDMMGGPSACACVPGAFPSPEGYGCTMCGANEVAQGTACACVPGYARLTPGGACELSSIGAACTGPEGCQEPFPYCATDGAERYCTLQSCEASSCPGGYACAQQTGGPSYCAKLPEGLNKPCMSDADCAAGEAKFCETMFAKTCQVSDCATGANQCPGSYGCCELAPGFSLCTPPTQLANGQCMFGMLVTP